MEPGLRGDVVGDAIREPKRGRAPGAGPSGTATRRRAQREADGLEAAKMKVRQGCCGRASRARARADTLAVCRRPRQPELTMWGHDSVTASKTASPSATLTTAGVGDGSGAATSSSSMSTPVGCGHGRRRVGSVARRPLASAHRKDASRAREAPSRTCTRGVSMGCASDYSIRSGTPVPTSTTMGVGDDRRGSATVKGRGRGQWRRNGDRVHVQAARRRQLPRLGAQRRPRPGGPAAISSTDRRRTVDGDASSSSAWSGGSASLAKDDGGEHVAFLDAHASNAAIPSFKGQSDGGQHSLFLVLEGVKNAQMDERADNVIEVEARDKRERQANNSTVLFH